MKNDDETFYFKQILGVKYYILNFYSKILNPYSLHTLPFIHYIEY